MKKFFTIFFIGIALVTSLDVTAQNSTKKTKVISPQFINNIELVPEASSKKTQNNEGVIAVIKPISKHISSFLEPIENFTPLQFKYAILTDRNVELITDTKLYKFIDSWMGTHYSYGGSDKGGIDCSSFSAKLIGAIFNASLPRTAREQYQACIKLTREQLKEGDLVFFNTLGGISHVGVYLGNNYFVHSSTSSGVMISSLVEPYYNGRFVSGGRPD